MEFLKNHYEKVVLSLVLLLMAGGAVVLVLEAGSVDEQLAEFRKPLSVEGGEKLPPPNATNYWQILSNATRGPVLELGRHHRVFNPDLWLVNTNNELVSGRDVGPHKLVVTRIEPLSLKLELGVSVTPDRTSYFFRGVKEYELTPSAQRLNNTTIDIARTNAVVLDRNRKMAAIIRKIDNPGENASIEWDLVIGAAEPIKMPRISKATPISHIIEYATALEYKPENLKWPPDKLTPTAPPLPQPIPLQYLLRKDARLYFAGDTNIIVDVTASNVVVRAVSNDKQTTVSFGVPSAPAPARRAP